MLPRLWLTNLAEESKASEVEGAIPGLNRLARACFRPWTQVPFPNATLHVYEAGSCAHPSRRFLAPLGI